MTIAEELAELLEATTMPPDLIDLLLRAAPALWLSSDTTALLAADLALCHPALAAGEVRARVSTLPQSWRLTVVAADRPGLLADTASVVAQQGCTIARASAASWSAPDLALHSVTILGAPPTPARLDQLGDRLRSPVATSAMHPFTPLGKAKVKVSGEADGDDIVSARAPDQPGLLAAICRWFADRDASIQAAWIAQDATGAAEDFFVVRGSVDCAALERFLSAPSVPERPMLSSLFPRRAR